MQSLLRLTFRDAVRKSYQVTRESLENFESSLRADVSKYQPEVYKSEKSKILKKINKVALGKLLT